MNTIFPATAARLEQWKAQQDVLGVLLVGSKSRGHNDQYSDDDLEVLLTDDAFAKLTPTACGELLIEGEGKQRKLIYDAQFTSLTDIRHKVHSTHDLDRWPYERARVLFDRTGEVTATVQAVGKMPGDFRHLRLQYATIDTWTAAARAQKTLVRGFEGAGQLLIARGAKALARILFALEWRWVPLDHWLEKELLTLDDPTQAGKLLIEALKTRDPALLDTALNSLDAPLEQEGVPRTPQGRHDLFFELIHMSRAEERSIHGLY